MRTNAIIEPRLTRDELVAAVKAQFAGAVIAMPDDELRELIGYHVCTLKGALARLQPVVSWQLAPGRH